MAREIPIELARQRDLNKYYQPWQASSTLKTIPIYSDDRPYEAAPPSHDTTLTALAQLATLRLRTKRCLISLIDSDTQAILAEATQTLSLVNNKQHAPGDNLWLGNVCLPRKDCMDEHVFGSRWTGCDSSGREHAFPALIVTDTLQDERFHLRPYVTSHPAVRFYAGVPIVTKQGHSIGVYAVSDTAPRPDGLTVEEVRFMQDVSQIITEHLERVKHSVDRDRGEGFIRSLTSFVEGLSSLKHQLEDVNQKKQTDSVQSSDGLQAVDPQPAAPESDGNHTLTPTNNSIGGPIVTADDQQNVNTTWPKHVRETSLASSKDGTDEPISNLRQIFSRAAKLLRKGLGAEGCVFYDAAPESTSSQSISVLRRSRSHSINTPDNSSSETLHNNSDRTNVSLGEDLPKPTSPKPQHSSDNACQILGSSFSSRKRRNSTTIVLHRKKLSRYLYKYPYGKVFYLDHGSVVTSDHSEADNIVTGGGHEDVNHQPQSKPSQSSMVRAENLPQEFSDQFPNAQWLIFLPLFNYSEQQWCAGGFMWFTDNGSSDPGDEMPYLKAFGSCIMSEVASMEAVNTNIAKTRFIASISHDLRSPLHGMLGSLEFLEDTLTSAYQLSLLGSIETCGKTLLDTIDHLLDFAKINNLNKNPLKSNSTASLELTKSDSRSAPTSPVATLDLAVLMEEVLEAVFAGQTFRKKRIRGHDAVDDATADIEAMSVDDSSSTEEQIHAGSAKFSGKVFVIFDLQKVTSWKVESQPGALRRVIMNIFGNCIKYCNEGAIEATLSMQPKSASEADVMIAFKDSGIGMSPNFLERHLFRAFSQEDAFTPGAGLGLSIVHQIVQSLKGTIRVESERGIGTNVTVKLPMQLAPSAADEEEEMLRAAVRVTRGKKLALLVPDDSNERVPDDKSGNSLSKLTASIAKMCKEWFDLDFTETTALDIETDFLMYREPPPIEVLTSYHSRKQAAGLGSKETALLIVCTNAFEAAALRAAGVQHLVSLGRIIEVISQPIGVRKLAKVLLQSCQRIQQSQSSTENSAPPSNTKPVQAIGAVEAKNRAAEIGWTTSTLVYDTLAKRHRPSVESLRWKSEQPQHFDRPKDQGNIEFGQIKSGVLPEMPSFEVKPKDSDSSSSPTSESHIPSVLLVDDNAINLKLLVTFVKKIKLPFAQAENGLEALEKFKEAANEDKPFDFVLMDLQMPVMDGLESTRKIREFERTRKVKKLPAPATTVIAITGVGDANVKAQCMDSGFDHFTTKPIKFKALQQMLEKEQQQKNDSNNVSG